MNYEILAHQAWMLFIKLNRVIESISRSPDGSISSMRKEKIYRIHANAHERYVRRRIKTVAAIARN